MDTPCSILALRIYFAVFCILSYIQKNSDNLNVSSSARKSKIQTDGIIFARSKGFARVRSVRISAGPVRRIWDYNLRLVASIYRSRGVGNEMLRTRNFSRSALCFSFRSSFCSGASPSRGKPYLPLSCTIYRFYRIHRPGTGRFSFPRNDKFHFRVGELLLPQPAKSPTRETRLING